MLQITTLPHFLHFATIFVVTQFVSFQCKNKYFALNIQKTNPHPPEPMLFLVGALMMNVLPVQ
jgi:hypothetical protein